jgi:hypothetical protein
LAETPKQNGSAWKTLVLAAAMGAGYAVGMRLLFGAHIEGFELLSKCFVIGTPVVIGFITGWFALRNRQGSGVAVGASVLAAMIFVLVCMCVGLEGIICVVLLAPFLLLVPLLGTLLAYLCWKVLDLRNRNIMPVVVLLPLLLSPVEQLFPVDTTPYTISDKILVHASSERVWREITNVRDIGQNELKPAFIFWMGVPKPLEARMEGSGVGAMRVSRWQKNVVFRERMTRWIPASEMAYDFIIDPRDIPSTAFDEHVTLAGKNYKILHGGYQLRALGPNLTEVTLYTTISNHSRTGLYGKIWSEYVFHDFHGVILDLIHNRSESLARPSPQMAMRE